MRITYIGHSGFAVECESGSTTLIFDYYIDHASVLESILERAKSVYVFVSHSHRDHLCHDIFKWHEHYPIAQFIIANECRRKLKRAIDLGSLPITFLHHDENWQDQQVAVHAFNSTDVGVSFLVTMEDKSIFHAGDYTCWQFEDMSDAEQRKARGDFHAILNSIKAHTPHMDVALMPVVPNLGGDFTYGARKLLETVNCDWFIPMHTWGRDREASQFDLYRNPNYGQCLYLREGENFTF